MTSAQVVETSVNVISNSPSQDYTHPDDRTLLYEIPCVSNFDGPSKHVNLLQQLIDVGNNPAVRTEVDADSGKQRRPKRKKDASNDGSKRKKK